MTVEHWLRDHRTETKNNFDCVTHSLKQIEKDYHRARGCVLSPHGLLLSGTLVFSYYSHPLLLVFLVFSLYDVMKLMYFQFLSCGWCSCSRRVVKGGLDHVSRKIKRSFHNSRKIK